MIFFRSSSSVRFLRNGDLFEPSIIIEFYFEKCKPLWGAECILVSALSCSMTPRNKKNNPPFKTGSHRGRAWSRSRLPERKGRQWADGFREGGGSGGQRRARSPGADAGSRSGGAGPGRKLPPGGSRMDQNTSQKNIRMKQPSSYT